MSNFKKGIFSFAFALVFLPPKKEMEDWGAAFSSKVLARENFIEKSVDPKAKDEKLSLENGREDGRGKSSYTPFKYIAGTSGSDKISFVLKGRQNAEWEVLLPPQDYSWTWEAGPWSGIALSTNEIHHFYSRELRRGPEPRYRTYGLGSEWQILDLEPCARNTVLLLQKNNLNKQKYRLTRIQLLRTQELKRDFAAEFEADSGEEYLKLKVNNPAKNQACSDLELAGWPKSFRVKL